MQTLSFIYDDLAFDDSRRLAGRQATAAALARCKMRFGAFLTGSTEDIAMRYDLVENDLRQVVADVVAEYGGDAEKILDSVTVVIAAGGFCDDCRKWKSGPKKGCECGSGDSVATPESAGADVEEDEPDVAKESSWKGRWKVVGEALQHERLPNGEFGHDPWGNGPSPKMDKTRWKPNALNDHGNIKVIDTDMNGTRRPTEHQDIGQIADHTKDFKDQTKAGEKEEKLKGTDGDAGFNTDKNQTQYPTRTFNDTHHQQDPISKEVWPAHNKSAASCPGCGANPNSETRCSICKGWDSARNRTAAGFGESAEAYPIPPRDDQGMHSDDSMLSGAPQGNCPNCNNPADPPECPHCGYSEHPGAEQGGDPSQTYGGGHAMDDPEQGMQPYRMGLNPKQHPEGTYSASSVNCEQCEDRVNKGDTRVIDGLRLCPDCRGTDTSDEPQTSELEMSERNSAVDPDKNPVIDLLTQAQIQQAIAAYRPRPA